MRKSLLAQEALTGLVRDYTEAPSSRGSGTSDLVLYMSTYLYYVYLERRRRGYGLSASKISMIVDHK